MKEKSESSWSSEESKNISLQVQQNLSEAIVQLPLMYGNGARGCNDKILKSTRCVDFFLLYMDIWRHDWTEKVDKDVRGK